MNEHSHEEESASYLSEEGSDLASAATNLSHEVPYLPLSTPALLVRETVVYGDGGEQALDDRSGYTEADETFADRSLSLDDGTDQQIPLAGEDDGEYEVEGAGTATHGHTFACSLAWLTAFLFLFLFVRARAIRQAPADDEQTRSRHAQESHEPLRDLWRCKHTHPRLCRVCVCVCVACVCRFMRVLVCVTLCLMCVILLQPVVENLGEEEEEESYEGSVEGSLVDDDVSRSVNGSSLAEDASLVSEVDHMEVVVADAKWVRAEKMVVVRDEVHQ